MIVAQFDCSNAMIYKVQSNDLLCMLRKKNYDIIHPGMPSWPGSYE